MHVDSIRLDFDGCYGGIIVMVACVQDLLSATGRASVGRIKLLPALSVLMNPMYGTRRRLIPFAVRRLCIFYSFLQSLLQDDPTA